MKRALLVSFLLVLSLQIGAKKITGNVHCADKMIPGVIVTDGFHFTTTDKDGFFRLKVSGDSRYVYIVTPSGYTADYTSGTPAFYQKLSKTIETVEDHYSKFRISDALMTIYKLFWDQFCAWYLELVKPAFGELVDGRTYEATMEFFEKLLKLIHPIMPFITEELWQAMAKRHDGETIMYERTPVAGPYDSKFLGEFELVQEAIIGVRSVRAQKQISPKEALKLYVEGAISEELIPILAKSANLGEVVAGAPHEPGCVSFIVGTVKMSIPLGAFVDADEEKSKIEAELAHQRGFLEAVRKKLSNTSFVEHAPAKVVETERKKEADSLARIAALEESLKSLTNN